MKKLLLPLMLIIISNAVYGQYPNYQQFGSVTTLTDIKGAGRGSKGFVVGSYADTATANSAGNYIKYYPGALIFTTDSSTLWLRNKYATAWTKPQAGNIDITSITFDNDTTGIICFSNGVCDTFQINNLTNVVNNLIQNFNDSTIYNINDSTIVICNGQGVCDTIHLGNSNTYNFLNDSTLVTCDTTVIHCVGDSCYQTTLCDTISIPKITNIVYQNGIRKFNNNIVEWGVADPNDNTSSLYHNTYIKASGTSINFSGGPVATPLFNIKNIQWTQLTPYILSLEHDGAYHPGWGLLDSANDVELNFNYTDPFFIPTLGTLTGDTIGYMGNRYGYMIVGNLPVKSNSAKQAGIFIDTYSPNDEGVSIFANQVPQNFFFEHIDSTFLDKRVAIFKTDKTVQIPGYPSTRDDGPNSKALYTDADGNILLGTVASSTVNVYQDTLLVICSYNNGHVSCDTTIISVGGLDVQNVFVINDSTLLVCNVDNTTCDTVHIPQTFIDRAFFDPNQGSFAPTTHFANGNDFRLLSIDTLVTTANAYFDQVSGLPFNSASTLRFMAVDTLTGRLYRTSGITGITADNGLTASTATNVQLFGTVGTPATLLHDSYLDATSSYKLFITGAIAGSTNYIFNVENTSVFGGGIVGSSTQAGNGVKGTSSGGYGVLGSSTNGPGGSFTSSTVSGVEGISTTGVGGFFQVIPSSTNTAVDVIQIVRNSSGTAANGLGGKINFTLQASDGTSNTSNEITSKWVDATVGSRTSQLDITGVNSASTGTIASFYGSGVVGIGISSSYTATRLNVVDNTVGAASIVDITSTSTAAASNLQKGLNISLSGVNATGGQSTYGGFISNTHSGTSTNYGLYSIANGGDVTYGIYGEITSAAGAGVQGVATSGTAVGGGASSGNGGVFTSTSGLGAQISSAGTYAIDMIRYGTSTNDVIAAIKSQRQTTGTAADGIGHSFDMYNEDASAVMNISNQIISKWTTAANATRTSQLDITGVNSASTNTIMSAYGSGVVGIGISSSYTATRLNVVDNAVGAASIVDITSTSTAAASNLQKGINVSLSGANATSGQSTYGIYSANTHTGGVITTNYALYGDASGGDINRGVGGVGTSQGVYGQSSAGTGVYGTSSSSFGVQAISTTGKAIQAQINPAGTNDIVVNSEIIRLTSGTAANGIGLALSLQIEADNGIAFEASRIASTWTTAANATRTGDLQFWTTNSTTSTKWMTIAGDGTVTMHKYGAGTATFDASGVISSVSDERVKTGISSFNYGLNDLMKINPITYRFNGLSGNETKHTYAGFSAQNVYSVLGDLGTGITSDGYMTLQDRSIIALLVNSVKEQQLEIEALKKQIGNH